MTYGQFLDCLEQEILKRSRGEEEIKRVRILKNNGVRLDGFSCRVRGHKEQPTVYVNQYYRSVLEPGELEETAKLVLRILRRSILKPGQDLEQILDYEKMKKHIFYRLVSRDRNKELLEQVPFLVWQDLALVFYLRIPKHIVEHATAVIYNTHMEQWKISTRDLFQTASENMAGEPVFLHPMEQLLDCYGFGEAKSGMYVLSNDCKEYGAAVIVDPRIQNMCARRLGEDYYILPSSVHEVILLPQSMATNRREIDDLIEEVNNSCVSREDYLSSHAYFYSCQDKKIQF